MSTLTTQGNFGVNGALNIQGKITANGFQYYDASGNVQDITSGIESIATTTNNVNQILNGSLSVPSATSAVTALGVATTAVANSTNKHYITFVDNTTGVNLLHTDTSATGISYQPSSNTIGCSNLIASGNISCNTGLSVGDAFNFPNATLNGISRNSLGYLVGLASAPVDTTSTQTISGAKTFSSLATFSAGISTNGETDTGTLTCSGLITANGGVTSSGTIQGNTVQTSNLSGISGQIMIQPSTVYLGSSSGTVYMSAQNTLWYNNGSLLYQPFSYGGLITISTATQNLLSGGNSGTLCPYYHLKSTYTTATPTLTLPDPATYLAGQEITFVRAGASSASFGNAINLTTVTQAKANFLINQSSTDISPTFTLGSSWYKIQFVCLPNPDATGTPYCWQQILYQ